MFNRLAHLVKLCKRISSNYASLIVNLNKTTVISIILFTNKLWFFRACLHIFRWYMRLHILCVYKRLHNLNYLPSNGYELLSLLCVCRIGFCRNNYLVIQFFIVNKWFDKVFVIFGITRISFMLFLGYFFSFSYCTCTQWSCWFYRVRFWWNQNCGFWNVRFVCKGSFCKRNCFCQ